MSYSPGDALESTSQDILSKVDTEVASILSAVDTEVAAIKSKTDLIGASVAPAAVRRIGSFSYGPNVSASANGASATNWVLCDTTNISMSFTTTASGIVKVCWGGLANAGTSGEPRAAFVSGAGVADNSQYVDWRLDGVVETWIKREAILHLTGSTSYTFKLAVANFGNSGACSLSWGGKDGDIWGAAYAVD